LRRLREIAAALAVLAFVHGAFAAEPLVLAVKTALVLRDQTTGEPVLSLTLMPDSAKAFGELTAANVGPEWQPLKSKMVVYVDAGGQRLGIQVDPSRPMAWREEPYYSQLKEWAVHGAQAKRQVIVYIKDRVIVLLPGKEVDLGVLERGDQVVVTPSGKDWTATRVAARDVTPIPPASSPAGISSA